MRIRMIAIVLGTAVLATITLTVPNPAAAQQKRYTGKRIDLDFAGIEIHKLMSLLEKVEPVHIVLDPSIKGTVTIKVQGVPWDEAFDMILHDKGLRAERQKDVIHVFPAK